MRGLCAMRRIDLLFSTPAQGMCWTYRDTASSSSASNHSSYYVLSRFWRRLFRYLDPVSSHWCFIPNAVYWVGINEDRIDELNHIRPTLPHDLYVSFLISSFPYYLQLL